MNDLIGFMGGGQNQTGSALLGAINQLMYQKMKKSSGLSPQDYKGMAFEQAHVPYAIDNNGNVKLGSGWGAPSPSFGG